MAIVLTKLQLNSNGLNNRLTTLIIKKKEALIKKNLGVYIIVEVMIALSLYCIDVFFRIGDSGLFGMLCRKGADDSSFFCASFKGIIALY